MSETKGLAGVRVGDTVMVSQYGRPYSPATVTKIGRKWVTVGNEGQFAIADGSVNSQYAGHAVTQTQHLENQERKDLARRLREHGVEVREYRFGVVQLRKLLDVVEE